ncbi:MAG: LysM peptidoglycan-binding domain-containing protein, partial [Pedosphaera sp.]|nr:LysM peptidoglycan-binding domain-containing protein [Pedosphaera sp.]
KSLREANHLKTDAIKVGQKLKLPAATIAPSTGTNKSPAPLPVVPPGDVPPLPPIK